MARFDVVADDVDLEAGLGFLHRLDAGGVDGFARFFGFAGAAFLLLALALLRLLAGAAEFGHGGFEFF